MGAGGRAGVSVYGAGVCTSEISDGEPGLDCGLHAVSHVPAASVAVPNRAHASPAAGFGSNSRDDEEEEEDDPLAVFDLPEAEPDRLFVNPFAAYNISPLQVRIVGWRPGMLGQRRRPVCSVHVTASFQ